MLSHTLLHGHTTANVRAGSCYFAAALIHTATATASCHDTPSLETSQPVGKQCYFLCHSLYPIIICTGYTELQGFSLGPAPRPGQVMVLMCLCVCLCACLLVPPPVIQKSPILFCLHACVSPPPFESWLTSESWLTFELGLTFELWLTYELWLNFELGLIFLIMVNF